MPQVLTTPTAEAAEIPQQEAVAWTPETLEAHARETAVRFGIPEHAYVETLRGESKGFTVTNGQSEIKDPKGPNGREDSWGTCQINLKWNPPVRKEDAQDPAWCMEWTAKRFKEGKASMWTEYRNLPRS